MADIQFISKGAEGSLSASVMTESDAENSFDIQKFLFGRPISELEIDAVVPHVKAKLQQALLQQPLQRSDDQESTRVHIPPDNYTQPVNDDRRERYFSRKRSFPGERGGGGKQPIPPKPSKKPEPMPNCDDTVDQVDVECENTRPVPPERVPRPYQTAFYEAAKKQNTIVHLGTGMGKTFIATLLIQNYLITRESDAEGPAPAKQVVFLVPTVALAGQQSETVQTEIPYCLVKTVAGSTKPISESCLKETAEADVLVATAGAYLELLRHYGDLFSIEGICLLILDECHHCTGKSPYADIMRAFYHRTPVNSRPRVLGLTASPIINAKITDTDEQLASQLDRLETLVDAKLVSLQSLPPEPIETGTMTPEGERGVPSLHQVEECPIWYDSTTLDNSNRLPNLEDAPLHDSRKVEFQQLLQLYEDLGPLAVLRYCEKLQHELSRNTFEQESHHEFNAALSYIQAMCRVCQDECLKNPRSARNEKLLALEQLLERELSAGMSERSTGIVFVQRRITAIALKEYFSGQARSTTTTQELCDEQFMDADENNDPMMYSQECESDNRFIDAGKDDDPSHELDWGFGSCVVSGPSIEEAVMSRPVSNERLPQSRDIRCSVLVRKVSDIFKSVSVGRKMRQPNGGGWLHQEENMLEVLAGFRDGKTNVLIATAVLEEGIDVQACSFVVVFDTLPTVKGYIQMKGRARRKNPKFFVFQDRGRKEAAYMSLRAARALEDRLSNFIHSARGGLSSSACPCSDTPSILLPLSLEPPDVIAAMRGFYEAPAGLVTLQSAKSLLFRVALSQPIDQTARSSSSRLQDYLPQFENDTHDLLLPASIGPSQKFRQIRVPIQFRERPKKAREGILCLMACVRLHQEGLLSDRLHPLSREDIRKRLASLLERWNTRERKGNELSPILIPTIPSTEQLKNGYIYLIDQENERMEKMRHSLKSDACRLALVTFQPLDRIEPFDYFHRLFGEISCKFEFLYEISFSEEQLGVVTSFYSVLMNARWKRRRKELAFRWRTCTSRNMVIPEYCVACLVSKNLDWGRMIKVVADAVRSKEERVTAAFLKPESVEARIWVPQYDEFAQYVAYGASQFTCETLVEDRSISYREFFRERGYDFPLETKLFTAHPMWPLPSRRTEILALEDGSYPRSWEDERLCDFLPAVLLPREVCCEETFADAGVFLECAILPQILHKFERCLTASRFASFCREQFTALGSLVSSSSTDEIITILSAKSCLEPESYERLEYLGDAVLKILQTDDLFKSAESRMLISNLHEGHLTSVRSDLGCNDRLASICTQKQIHHFILSACLSRGQWTPNSLERYTSALGTVVQSSSPSISKKTRADVVEAILGHAYLAGGYSLAASVADELGITNQGMEELAEPISLEFHEPTKLVNVASNFTGYQKFSSPLRVKEAFTHPTSLTSEVPSYQKLEWIGDAVVCMAVREWAFRQFYDRPVGDLVLMETTLVSNRALAFIALYAGLFRFLDHRDRTLSDRVDAFEISVRQLGLGLWGTRPPKPMADMVESILGAVHLDGGFQAGQRAALHVLNPLLQAAIGGQTSYHPRQQLSQLLGEWIQSKSVPEREHIKLIEGSTAWTGELWDAPEAEGQRVVVSVSCFGQEVVSVFDEDELSGDHRACAFVLEAMKGDEALMSQLLDARATLARSRFVGHDRQSADKTHEQR